MKWFYSKNIQGDKVIIDGEEFRHMVSVMRVRIGEEVVVFNGEGLVCACSVLNISKKDITLTINKKQQVPAMPMQLTLAAAAIKGERQDIMLRQATELGVTDIVLLSTDRSEVVLNNAKLDRIEKQIIASCKQCHRAYMPKVSLCALKDFNPLNSCVLVGSFNAQENLATLDKKLFKNNVVVLVGPEGGFSPAEEENFDKKGYKKVSLGENVLRADTAAAMLVSYAKCIKEW